MMLGVWVKVSDGVMLGGTSVAVGAKAVSGGASSDGISVIAGTKVEVG
jgi:hypothetical protein